ncbi:hypothetical protein LR48_Vigan03g165000 [Vigna angularis]|uniref:Putative plant transposon protein domain-containing protein n=1 Tax=Phaseolus angularis TaxID=3914 RepID=A0A0L9U612_PHAAN|nr:hypothetical protein LR48_Vigan03g165000 [Vigna angularis]
MESEKNSKSAKEEKPQVPLSASLPLSGTQEHPLAPLRGESPAEGRFDHALVGQIAKKLEEIPIKTFVANTEVNPKEECKAIVSVKDERKKEKEVERKEKIGSFKGAQAGFRPTSFLFTLGFHPSPRPQISSTLASLNTPPKFSPHFSSHSSTKNPSSHPFWTIQPFKFGVLEFVAARSSNFFHLFEHYPLILCLQPSGVEGSLGLNINIGQVIADEIKRCARGVSNKAPLGHPSLITHLCARGVSNSA